ncbi:DUF192 domain-containing protein [Taylorella equigenitalis]|uniref:DUF192 domain-containing protein n=1 Tax=Taylorella equigenitalis TaxID=29575 RepID=UPI00042413BC|nr:DUF192 domain-containing protein [Taylorella equigenitalis]ASY38058.1 hypothetical protein CA605_05095 [Taylorella equigenitalis]ASY42478.1 hypothetical protein CA943_05090 [Taylorella equigenitalis]KGK34045.1 hypothetical protein LW90_00320 [Taylorella equigenitalis]RBA26781.1 DUF192 domain-containing protein [Taylorella equigenitalis]WDU45901.1 DUF192 domain-containing protein [Taylorella equigenitalis]
MTHKLIKKFSLFLLFVGLISPVYADPAQKTLIINDSKLSVEIADTPSSQQLGLMHRETLDPNHGMLFVFEEPQNLCFWMKNTLIPLSIAYIDQNFKIIDILDMQPLDETPICAKQDAQYALEVNQGWFKLNNIKIGDLIGISK